MDVAFMPNALMMLPHPQVYRHHPAHYEHPYTYHHHRMLLQQQVNNNAYLRKENNISLKSRWTFPGVNMLKLNTDGSSKGNPGPSSFGGLIRDGKGRWICGYMGKIKGKSCTAFEAEVWSVYKGLCLIKDKNMSNLFIETDCEAVMRLGWKEADTDHPLKLVMDDITKMMKEQKCVMLHTRRDGNQCADHMARLGGTRYEEYIVFEEPPMTLKPYLLRDIEAAYEFQRSNNHDHKQNK